MSEVSKEVPLMNQQFVSNRDVVVRSKKGHSIEFKKGVPTQVPKALHEEVMEKGILPVDEAGLPVSPAENKVSEDKPKIVLAPDDADERAKAIVDVIKAILKRNNPSDFTGGNRPGAAAVTAALGYKVDQKEVNVVWEKNRTELLEQK